MSDISLKLQERTAEGKKVISLRKAGFVPSVVYGAKIETLKTQSPYVETLKAVHAVGKHTPLNISLDGKKKLAIIKDIDFSPVKHMLRHVAFHIINQNDVITTEVPIILVGMGESPAERAGLVILQAIEDIEIKAKPSNLPKSIEVSVAGLETDEDRITIADIKLPEGVEFADVDQDMDLVIANVYEPGALQAANDAAGGEAEEESEVPTEEPATTVEDKKESSES